MKSWIGIDYFAQPEALLLLLLLPLYILWYRRYYRPQRLLVRLSYDPDKLQKPQFNIAWMRVIPRELQTLAIILLILALARPQRSEQVTEQQDLGADVMVVLDVSRSMENKDVAPSRFIVAKSALVNVIEQSESERFGLVLAGPAALHLSPLTFDHEFLQGLIERTSPSSLPGEGTALGPALGLALNRLQDSDASQKMILVFSDGGANGGDLDPLSASKVAQRAGIPIHTIGVAGEKPGKLQDLALLEQISKQSGGSHLPLYSRTAIPEIWHTIHPAQNMREQARIFRVAEDRYPVFIQLAIVCLALAYLLMLTSIYNPLEQ